MGRNCSWIVVTLLVLAFMVVSSCSKEEKAEAPTVKLFESAIIVSYTKAGVSAEVTDDGGAEVKARGIIYGKPNGTVDTVFCGGGMGVFSAELPNLEPNTYYNYEAFARNVGGMGLSGKVTFCTKDYSLPTVNTSEAEDIGINAVTIGGEVTKDGDASITERGVCWNTSPNPTLDNSHATAGEGIGKFTCDINGLTANTTYHVRAYATNTKGTAYGGEVSFSTLDYDLPEVVTLDVTDITQTTAKGGGQVTSDGGTTVTGRGICWSTSHDPTIDDNHVENGSGTGSFTCDISGLIAHTTYYVRAYAINVKGTVYGNEKSFNTSACLPTVSTGSVTGITFSTAVGDGNVVDDGGSSVSERGVCWSESPNPTISGPHNNNGTGIGVFTVNMNGLSVHTNYYYKAYAINGVGVAYGEEKNFMTLSATIPEITTSSVTNISQTTATTGGIVVSDGGSPVTERGICWSTSHNPTINGQHESNGTGIGSFTVNLSGLTINTTYYVRGYAVNSQGTAYGDEVEFKTDGAHTPTVTTKDVTSITLTSAASGGNVVEDGGAEVTARGVCWSTSPNPTLSNQFTTNGTGIGNFTSNLIGLTEGTKYYIRAYATNSVGTSYGEQKDFTTQSVNLPTITTNNVTNITKNSAKCGGNITNNGGGPITARGVCWSTSPNPTLNNYYTTNGTGTCSFTSNITGLTQGTTYYVKAYATNSSGTSYGEQKTFTTLDIPTVTTKNVTNVTSTTASCGGNVTNDGGATVHFKGVCWSTSPNPTFDDSHTNDGSGTGNYTSTITGLVENTTYYLRAYAVNNVGVGYGTQKVFHTTNSLEEWLYYGDFNNHVDCWGLSLGGTSEWAVMFPTSILTQYEGTSITKVRAYLGITGSYTLKIYRGGSSQPSTLLLTKAFNVTSTGWNIIDINPLVLTTSSTLWVSITTTYSMGYYPKGACAGVNNPNARWSNSNGNGWEDIIETNGGQDLCWEIQACVTSQVKGEEGVEIWLPQMNTGPKSSTNDRVSRNPNEVIKRYKND